MKNSSPSFRVSGFSVLIAVSVSLFSCEKNENDLGDTPSTGCNTFLPNKLSATVSGSQFCSDSACIADYGTELYINGTSMDGRILTLFLDSIEPGTYTIGTDVNSIIYIDPLGLMSFSSDDQPGELVITSHDLVSNRVKGRFNAVVKDPLLSASSNISSGTFDVIYLE
ncbi:MAG: DUF6252 family protein [Bacteroidota bacterium]